MEEIKTLVYLSSNQSLVTSTNQEFIDKCERKLSCEQFAEEYVNGLKLDNTLVRVIKTYNDGDYVCCTNAEDVIDGAFELLDDMSSDIHVIKRRGAIANKFPI